MVRQKVFQFPATYCLHSVGPKPTSAPVCAVFHVILLKYEHLALQGGCITKLEGFLADHLLVIGAVGIGVACMQVRPKIRIRIGSVMLLCSLDCDQILLCIREKNIMNILLPIC